MLSIMSIIEAWSTGRYDFAVRLVNTLVESRYLLIIIIIILSKVRRIELFEDEICVGQVT